jgi:transcriptional regulator with XRE-family HTH domain
MQLRKALEKKRWSITKLAAESGVNKSTVSRLVRGETRPMNDTAAQLENALGLERGTLKFGQRESAA